MFSRYAISQRMIIIAIIIIICTTISWAEGLLHRYLPNCTATISGYAYISDGDGLVIKKQRIRFLGMDAPEYKQKCYRSTHLDAPHACGIESTKHLKKLINNRPVRCYGKKYDKYGRLLAHCFAGQTDLNKTMVSDGWAVSFGLYEKEEKEARIARKGMWQYGYFQKPQLWRRYNLSFKQ